MEHLIDKFKAEIQKYNFSGNKKNEEGRLITKSDYIKFDNNLIFDGVTTTTYDIGYKSSKNPYGKKNKNSEQFTTGLGIKFDEDTNLNLKYTDDKRFTSKTNSGKNVNDLSMKQYSINFETKNMI